MRSLKRSRLVLVGASTGGPGHLQRIAGALPSTYSASVVIAQHIGDDYLPSFIRQLQSRCAISVLPARPGEVIRPGCMYVCSGLTRIVATSSPELAKFERDAQPPPRFNPDIDCLFSSASALTNVFELLGIILTGIGDDGAVGCRELSRAGAECIAESEESAVVYGMPQRAAHAADTMKIQHLDKIIQSVVDFGQA